MSDSTSHLPEELRATRLTALTGAEDHCQFGDGFNRFLQSSVHVSPASQRVRVCAPEGKPAYECT